MRANKSLVPNKHPLTFAQLSTSEGTLPNANEGICHRSFAFAVPSTYTYFRRTNAFVRHSFGICVWGLTFKKKYNIILIEEIPYNSE